MSERKREREKERAAIEVDGKKENEKRDIHEMVAIKK